MWRFWGQSPYDRVLTVLANQQVPSGIRQLARLARVSPQTAKRVGDDLVVGRKAARVRHRETRTVRYLLKADTERKLRRERRLPLRDPRDQFAFLASTGAPVWILDKHAYSDWLDWHRIPTFLALPRSWRHLVPHPRPYVVFKSARPLQAAREELPPRELLIALLKLVAQRDAWPGAARSMYVALDLSGRAREGLLRRIRHEGLGAAARAARIPLDLRNSR